MHFHILKGTSVSGRGVIDFYQFILPLQIPHFAIYAVPQGLPTANPQGKKRGGQAGSGYCSEGGNGKEPDRLDGIPSRLLGGNVLK